MSMKDLNGSLWEGGFEVARDKNYFCPVAILFRKKRKKKRKWREDGCQTLETIHSCKFEESKMDLGFKQHKTDSDFFANKSSKAGGDFQKADTAVTFQADL